MTFAISPRTRSERPDVTILDVLSSRITLGEGSVILRDEVRDQIKQGHKLILLNLGNVSYIDNSGVGELVSAATVTKNSGGELKLLSLTRKVHDLLQITKLYQVFDVKDDEAAAVASFPTVRNLAPNVEPKKPGFWGRMFGGNEPRAGLGSR